MPETRGQIAGARLQAEVERMLTEIVRLPLDLITWQPAWDVWSVMDILCHVQEFIPYWTAQAVHVVEHPDQRWGRDHADPGRLAAVSNTTAKRLSDVVHGMRQSAAESAARLARLTDAQLDIQAPSRNPRWGMKPASFIVEHLLVAHVEKHLGQIRRNESDYRDKGSRVSEFVFPPAPPASAPVHGQEQRFPIRRIFCVGRNYEGHAKEMGNTVDREAPFYFTKAAPHYAPTGSTIAYPPGTSNYHYEMEMVAAIGKAGFHIPEAQALEHVFGYACGLDMTRRDLQSAAKEKQRPWDIGKDFEESAVIGEIAPASVIGHVTRGRIELRINGVTRQSSDVSDLIHPVAAIVAHLSQYYHLHPGDVIFTGTPEGVGAVKPGDHLEGSIEGVGIIEARIGGAS